MKKFVVILIIFCVTASSLFAERERRDRGDSSQRDGEKRQKRKKRIQKLLAQIPSNRQEEFRNRMKAILKQAKGLSKEQRKTTIRPQIKALFKEFGIKLPKKDKRNKRKGQRK